MGKTKHDRHEIGESGLDANNIISSIHKNHMVIEILEPRLIETAVHWAKTGEENSELSYLTKQMAKECGVRVSSIPIEQEMFSERRNLVFSIIAVCVGKLTPGERKKLYIRLVEILQEEVVS